jgi:tetratricopeptide (TPR) repeat protein
MTRRARVRLWLTLGGIPFAVAAILLAVKLMSLQVVTASAIDAFDAGDYASSEQESGSLVDNSLVEPWIPYFDRGDAKVGADDLTRAIDDFERALDLAPTDRRCMVALNLAATWESLGDEYEASQFHQGAVQLYQNAQKVLDGVDEDCEVSGQKQERHDQQAREKAKEDAAARARDEQEQADPGSDPGDKLDQLGDKQAQSDQDKQNGESRNRAPLGGIDVGGSGKPW